MQEDSLQHKGIFRSNAGEGDVLVLDVVAEISETFDLLEFHFLLFFAQSVSTFIDLLLECETTFFKTHVQHQSSSFQFENLSQSGKLKHMESEKFEQF